MKVVSGLEHVQYSLPVQFTHQNLSFVEIVELVCEGTLEMI